MTVISMILDMEYPEFAERFGKRWAWRWRETVTLLGDKFDEAMQWAAKVPEWADDRSRILFLGKVAGTLAGVPSWLLPEQSFDLEADENTKLPVIEVESDDGSNCPF